MLSLPIPVLLAITVITSALVSIMRGTYSKSLPSDAKTLWFFNLMQNIFCALMILAVMGGLGNVSPFTVGLGAVLGFVSAFQLRFNLLAFSIGPFSYTTVIVSLSAIIPTLSGLFFGESISLIQWLGILMMVVCIILSPGKTNGEHAKKSTAKWLLACLPAALFSGTVGVLQKIHQSSSHASEKAAFLVSAFAVATVISAVFFMFSAKGAGNENESKRDKLIRNLFPIFTGVAFAFPHTINLDLAGKLDSAVMFPIVNLTPMILSTVVAMIMFRERLSGRRWIGLIIGVLATIFVSGIIRLP